MTTFYTLSKENPTIVLNISKTEKQMTFPSTPLMTEIYEYACSNGAAEYVNLASTKITIIGSGAFAGCYSLTNIIFPETLQIIRQNAFLEASFIEINIPKNVREMSGCAWNQISTVKAFNVDKENNYFCSIEGCLLNKKRTKLYRLSNNITYCSDLSFFNEIESLGEFSLTTTQLKTFIATPKLREIEPRAFHALSHLYLIDLTYSNITFLPGEFVWSELTVKTIRLPAVLEEISENAIVSSNKLTTLIIYTNLKVLNPKAFNNCPLLRTIIFYGVNDFSGIEMSSGTTNIELIHVYTTKLYQHKDFGQVPVEFLKFPSCMRQSLFLSLNPFPFAYIILFSTLI